MEMDHSGDDLENTRPQPTIQFVVKNEPHRHQDAYDLRYDGKLYPFGKIFNPQLVREEKVVVGTVLNIES